MFNTEINLNNLLIFHSWGNKTEPLLCTTEAVILTSMLISKLACVECLLVSDAQFLTIVLHNRRKFIGKKICDCICVQTKPIRNQKLI